MPFGWAAGAAALGSVASAAIGASAASDAADAQLSASNNSLALQREMFNTTQSNLEPYNTTGQNALQQLASIYGLGGGGPSAANAMTQLQNFPGYQFDLSQGMLALQRSAAAQSGNVNGGALKDLMTFGTGLASNEFGNYTNMLQGLAGLGENAAAGVGNAATAFGSNGGNSLLAGGQAAASGIVGGANAITGSLNNGISNQLLLSALNNNRSPSGFNVNSPGFANTVNNDPNFTTNGITFTQ
jgi:hypothetical protein